MRTLYQCLVLLASTVVASAQPAPTAGHNTSAATSKSPAGVNDFKPANRRDGLASSLARLAHSGMSADLSTAEPWLFDRASSYYKLALWSGDKALREHAFELVQRYYSLIDANGDFALKRGDAKYSYVDGAVWYERETGDPRFRTAAESVYRLWLREFPATYAPTLSIWTEREMAYAFGAAVSWYELSGDEQALTRARTLIQQWADMSAESGAPLHTLAQHQEDFEPPWGNKRMTSPWMASLFFEYAQRYERLTRDKLALQLVSKYADFLLANCLYDGSRNHRNLSGYVLPYYLCGELGTYYERETPSEGDGEHTPDVMGIMAFAVHAKRDLQQDPAPALKAYRQLRESAEFFVGRRSDVNPPRKINWWVNTSYSASRLVE